MLKTDEAARREYQPAVARMDIGRSERVRSSDVTSTEAIEFSELQLSDAVLRGLAEAGFERPSPIQAKAIPLGRFGIDLIAQAKSGTGKTVVFAAIALEAVHTQSSGPQALVVAPTREVALQSRDVCRVIGSHLSQLSCHAFVGGTPMRTDKAIAGSCHIACGTPGRLVALLLCEAMLASRVRLLVLDEADKLLESGFEQQLRYLLTALPERKQTLAFSATYPDSLLQALRASMRNPFTISLLPPPSADSDDDDDDPDDPFGLLEKPHVLGSAPMRAEDASDAVEQATAADSAGSAPLRHAARPRRHADVGKLVSDAALVGVKQFFHVVETTSRVGRDGRRGLAEQAAAEVRPTEASGHAGSKSGERSKNSEVSRAGPIPAT